MFSVTELELSLIMQFRWVRLHFSFILQVYRYGHVQVYLAGNL